MAQDRDNEFYKTIQGNDNPFVRGWIDVAPKFISGFTPYNPDEYKNYDPDTAYLVYYIKGRDTVDARSEARFGFSELQKEFESKFSGHAFTIFPRKFLSASLDRIVSAVDAGITARAYNDEMLGNRALAKELI